VSGFQNITGFAPPISLGSFMSLLQNAAWRGVPFKVVGASVRKGRKFAIHDYPFRDGGWAEDMGRAQRTYGFTGYLIGDLAPALQLALDAAAERPGPGLLIHPTIGAVNVSLLSCATAVRRDAMRVIEVAFEFIEQGDRLFPSVLIATAFSVLAAADIGVTACGSSLGGVAGPAASAGGAAIGEGVAVTQAFATACLGQANDPAALVAMAAGLQADPGSSYGRFGAGNASLMLPIGTTIGGLQAQVAAQRATVATAGAAAVLALGQFTAATGPAAATAIGGLTEATRLTMTDPADQVRVLSALAGFTFMDSIGASGSYLGADMATVRDAAAALCRRMALVSLARSSAAYQPVSYQDAAGRREALAALFDAEITAAGDAGEDDAYTALKALRAAVIADLTARGASLPQVVTAAFRASLPALMIAQMLYRDASRSDEITREAGSPHPGACPLSFQVLAA
jgi:prophage DNA circulation protein